MTHEKFPDTHHDISHNTLFGFWIYLMTDCIMFASFFAGYAVLRTGTFGGPGPKELFHLPFVLVESLILMGAGFSSAMAMTQLKEKSKIFAWFSLTFILGAIFLLFTLHEFRELVASGNSWDKNAFPSAYFTLIGVHGLHIIAGLAMLIVFLVQLNRWGITEPVVRRLTCLRMYWQFLYLIWIFTFTIVYLMGVS